MDFIDSTARRLNYHFTESGVCQVSSIHPYAEKVDKFTSFKQKEKNKGSKQP